MTKRPQKQPTSDMEHVWKDISDIWEKLTSENDNPSTTFALTREIDAAGRFTDEVVEKIYARYDFCEGYTNRQLKNMQTLVLNLKSKGGQIPKELEKLQLTLNAKITREQQLQSLKLGKTMENSWTEAETTWQTFSPSAKSTWPEKHQNVVFGPQFSYPISARFDSGVWYRHGANTPLSGVTKYMYVPAPRDWG
ncbi:MAG: hypothetical protein IH995_05680 [Proteobacteria bacterium]|nr:hypothetical protein [Pseudomonadota bacterium]